MDSAELRRYLDEDEQAKLAAAKAASSGALGGAVMTGGAKLLSGERNIGALLRRAAIGGLGSAALAGGATYLGSKLMGAPEEGDPGAYTHRGALGGAVGGGALGLGLGALLGTGKLQKIGALLGKTELGHSLGKVAKEELPVDNLLADKLKEWAGKEHGGLKSGALLGGALGGVAGAMGSSEGMEQDFVQNELAAARRKKMMQDAYERY